MNLNDPNVQKPLPTVFCRSAYNYDTAAVSLETGLVSDSETRTQQHQAKECDINYIVQQFGVTGLLPNSTAMPTYQDFDGVFDYQTALNLIISADEKFMELPATARARFQNDPAKFIDFLDSNPEPQVLLDLGLADVIVRPQTTPQPPQNSD